MSYFDYFEVTLRCPQCGKQEKLYSFIDIKTQECRGICRSCDTYNEFIDSSKKPDRFLLAISLTDVKATKDRIDKEVTRKEDEADKKHKEHIERSKKLREESDHIYKAFNPNLPERITLKSISEAANLAGKINAQNNMVRANRSGYCCSPGCTTKLKNKYSSICSYCKSKNGYYRR